MNKLEYQIVTDNGRDYDFGFTFDGHIAASALFHRTSPEFGDPAYSMERLHMFPGHRTHCAKQDVLLMLLSVFEEKRRSIVVFKSNDPILEENGFDRENGYLIWRPK